MTPLPPLPFIDGTAYYGEPCLALVFDNSALEDWQTCKRLWQYKDLERFAPTTEAAGRNFGSGIHRALEALYKCPPDQDKSVVIETALRTYFDSSPPPMGDFRGFSHAQAYMAEYLRVYPKEPWTILATPKGEPFVERTFALPFGELPNPAKDRLAAPVRIIYAGKIDLGIHSNDDWTMDHKTTFQFGSSFAKDMEQNGGQIGYTWAFRQSLGRRPRGYVINAMRVRKPSRGDEFSSTAPIDSSDFQRIPFDVSDESLDDWRQDVLALIEEVLWCHARGYFPRHRKACVGKYGLCDFYNVCSVVPSARRQILESSLYEPNDWTPLNKPQ